MQIQGKPQWDFCCEWYGVDEIEKSIARDADTLLMPSPIPIDIRSRGFAEFMAHQYRLAMNKGIELAERELQEQNGGLASAARDLAGQRLDDISKLNAANREIERLKAENIAIQRSWVPERFQSTEARQK